MPTSTNERLKVERGFRQNSLHLRGLEQKIKSLEIQKRNAELDCMKLRKQNEILRKELDRLRAPPLVTAIVEDILADGRIIVKSSTGPNLVVNASHYIDRRNLMIGARVAMNQSTLSIIEILPPSRDMVVSGMEIIKKPRISYKDIGGLVAQIEEMKETVELPLKCPEKFEKVGIDPPVGVLLFGPPGNGKTRLAKAVACESSSTFIKVVGTEFVKKFIGEGARIVREVFQFAREKSPTIIFIDELDAIGARRTDSGVSGDREVQRTMMQLLSEMDGFDPTGNVKIIAATNRPDILDPALLRPGRFDRLIEIPLPNEVGREEILKIHTKKMNLRDVDLREFASEIEGASGADIKSICTEAGMFAIREERDYVSLQDLKLAAFKVLGSSKEEREPGMIYG
ncbi:MAG: proteasome-activating nucleotidase [Candidatus Methanofastidiosia archaeon]